jgi:hypothetical protein
MGRPCHIGPREAVGTIRYIRCSYDGYLEHGAEILAAH